MAKNPEIINLDDLLNAANLDPNYEEESNDDIESRITNKKEIETTLDLFAEEGTIEDSTISDSSSEKETKKESESYHSEDKEEDDNKYVVSTESSFDDVIPDSSDNSEDGIFINKKTEPELRNEKEKITDKNHKKIISHICEFENEYFDNINTKIPKYDKKKILRDKVYAEEVYSMLDDMYKNNSLAMEMREFICFATNLVDMICDGKENKLLNITMPNLVGYSNEVRRNINQVKKETTVFAKELTSTKVGTKLSYLFKLFKIFGLPLFTVYNNNKRKKENIKEYNYSIYDSEDEESSS